MRSSTLSYLVALGLALALTPAAAGGDIKYTPLEGITAEEVAASWLTTGVRVTSGDPWTTSEGCFELAALRLEGTLPVRLVELVPALLELDRHLHGPAVGTLHSLEAAARAATLEALGAGAPTADLTERYRVELFAGIVTAAADILERPGMQIALAAGGYAPMGPAVPAGTKMRPGRCDNTPCSPGCTCKCGEGCTSEDDELDIFCCGSPKGCTVTTCKEEAFGSARLSDLVPEWH